MAARRRALFVAVPVLLIGAALSVVAPAVTRLVRSQAQPPAHRLDAVLGALPLSFVENHGQLPAPVSFAVTGSRTSLYFGPDGVTFDLGGSTPKQGVGHRFSVSFVDAHQVTPAAEHPLPGTVSYLGSEVTGLSTYGGVVYRNLWPGIDLHYAGTGGRLKYRFVVHPGADPHLIRLAYRGATNLALGPDGALAVRTSVGEVVDQAPSSYQGFGHGRTAVGSDFVLDAASLSVEFRVGPYDRGRDLVIDPAVVVSAGLLGGSGDEWGQEIATDPAGDTYVIGTALRLPGNPLDFPVVVGPYLTTNPEGGNFIAKIDPTGHTLLYAGYLRPSGNLSATGLAVDAAGHAYVTGFGADASFPVVVGPDLTNNDNKAAYPFATDSFVAEVKVDGTGYEYAGFLGGSNADYAQAIAIDGAGNAYVTGWTVSADFPSVVGPPGGGTPGGQRLFVTKVWAGGTGLAYSGFFGGTGDQHANAVAVDSVGNAYITGDATSSASFPGVVGPSVTLTAGADGRDAFVVKVHDGGAAVDYAGFIGGHENLPLDPSQSELGRDIAVGPCGPAVGATECAFVVGDTSAPDFPTTVGPPFNGSGNPDAFVAEVRADGTGLVYARLIGGGGFDVGAGIAADGAGNVVVTGQTDSTQRAFPVINGPDSRYNGGSSDAWVAELDPAAAFVYSGFVGGSGRDEAYSVALDTAGRAHMTGITCSHNFPTTRGSFDTHLNGHCDAFMATVAMAP